ncbi:hypothetical protein GYMLUDRAFT_260003 [Collybiopsis luxurians FD-317 M1]|uniref:Uncharacterized protein n=1 Tax=Collybiopsis luxurians FD-317 M1 TaxID=944289 RepID=A0A0D0D0Z3_9AGAR|nr:hypothetical protein GYMLUDRAFT_260003 [Collybiopsis luxurians FD-317 M1]
MALRAYILRSDFSVDSARPVALETLDALGWKTASLTGSRDLDQSARSLVHEWGIPLTQEDSVVPLDLKKGADNPPKVAQILAKIFQFSGAVTFATTVDGAILLKTGNTHFDLEDVVSKNWIRMELGPGQIFYIPAGAKLRFTFSDQATNMAGLAFIKGGLANAGVVEEKVLDNLTIRGAYLHSVGKI